MRENFGQSLSTNSPSFKTAKTIINACADAKGKDISVLNVSKIFGIADFFVIVSGRSDRQVQGITNRVMEALEQSGVTPVAIEGFEDGQWVLVDYGDVVVHVFYEPLRERYDLEGLWSSATKLQIEKAKSGDLKLKAA